MEYNFKSMGYKMARIDEDGIKVMNKGNFASSNNKNNNYHAVKVKLDEDELECLRKLGESSTSRNKVSNLKVATNNNNNNNDNNSVICEISSNNSNNNDDEETYVFENCVDDEFEEDINESAEKFIRSFKKQLLLQRLESIENVDKMLARGL
ncbi:hypothetical protein vseg_018430 [Gypsophila vaccaria]